MQSNPVLGQGIEQGFIKILHSIVNAAKFSQLTDKHAYMILVLQ
ncbi:unnamed protein product [Linum tenue]|uniref:Uncharacterized protein n=1 Tax=Linum tenue TaxID=586396 RepID=A0AAV0M8B4_9ROSI|nr:unnamed protein product [Linum tenue]